MNLESPIIDLKGIHFRYPGGKTVLNHLDFKFYRGDRTGLIGPNGSGKTTLFHLIMGLIKPVSGKIELFGKSATTEKDFEEVRRRIGLLFQDPDDQLFSPTVMEDVAFGPLNLGKSKKEAQNIARRTLANLDLEGFEDRITFKLSGGEKRLVSLATVLAMEPEVLLLDEPLNGLDVDKGAVMNQVFQHLHLPPELATEFMAVFSRFEHALKSTNYAIGDENRVDAAWDRFANDIDDRFNDIQDDHLAQCVDFLMTEPPRKQVLDGNRIRFQDQTVDPNQRPTQQLLRFVRTVRNNLFHGGKYLPDGEVEVGRNKKLVESALYVLQTCVRIDERVRNSFEQ